MRQFVLFPRVRTAALPVRKPTRESAQYASLSNLAGYILEQPFIPAPSSRVRAWGSLVILTGLWFEPVKLPVTRTLRPVRSGRTYRITSPLMQGLVAPHLAEALETVFERYALERGFTPERPLEIQLSRGFKAGSPGHGEGRAADIGSVGGKGLLAWKQAWDQALNEAARLSHPQQRMEVIAAERGRNLGYGLYKTLQAHAGWRPYRGVVQLFGPWTRTEGPWKIMQIQHPSGYQKQRLRDQQWVFRAHQDHIHVAR